MANKVIKYFIESKEELQKVTWPTQKETIRYTALVVGITVALALFFGLVDFGSQTGLDALLNFSGSSSDSGIDLRTAPAPASIETEAGPTIESDGITIEGSGDGTSTITIEGEDEGEEGASNEGEEEQN